MVVVVTVVSAGVRVNCERESESCSPPARKRESDRERAFTLKTQTSKREFTESFSEPKGESRRLWIFDLWPALLQSWSGSNSPCSLGARERSPDDLLLFERVDGVEAQRLL